MGRAVSDDARAHAGQALVTLRRRVDDHFAAALARSGEAMRCAPGCDACCQDGLSAFGIEADAIKDALAEIATHDPALRDRIRRQGEAATRSRCALLVDGRCSVYAVRPLLCRAHGLPLRSDDATIAACSLNFTTRPPDPASVLEMHAVDAPLSIMARMWDGGDRIALAEIARSG